MRVPIKTVIVMLLRVQQFIIDKKNQAYYADTRQGLEQAKSRIREIIDLIKCHYPSCVGEMETLTVDRVRAGDDDAFEEVWRYEDSDDDDDSDDS